MRQRESCECKSLSRIPRPRKRRIDDVDVVEEVQSAKAEKKSSCPFCKVQEGDLDNCQPATAAELGTRRIRLRDGMDDYCYILIVLQFGHLQVKDVRLRAISSDLSLPASVVAVSRKIMPV